LYGRLNCSHTIDMVKICPIPNSLRIWSWLWSWRTLICHISMMWKPPIWGLWRCCAGCVNVRVDWVCSSELTTVRLGLSNGRSLLFKFLSDQISASQTSVGLSQALNCRPWLLCGKVQITAQKVLLHSVNRNY
jgi:hypothetical protein